MTSLETSNIYAFTDASEYLKRYWVLKKKDNPSFTSRAWARHMGMKTHSLLIHLLSGRRKVLPSHLPYLKKGLKISSREWKYFEALVRLSYSKSDIEREFYLELAESFHPDRSVRFLDLDENKIFSHWIYFCLLEMTALADFKNNPNWISERLGKTVSPVKIEEAISRLLSLNLLEIKNGKLFKTHQRLATNGVKASRAIREYHKQILTLASQSVENQTKDERLLNSFSITIDPKSLPKASELIMEFREKFSRLLEKKGGNETYQLSLQFFKLTQSLKESI